MKYKGYWGSAAYDDDAEVFYGSILGIKDVVTFQGRSVDEIKQVFKDSVNDYLDFCKERGEKPFNLEAAIDPTAVMCRVNKSTMSYQCQQLRLID